jgi:hypothetical protein
MKISIDLFECMLTLIFSTVGIICILLLSNYITFNSSVDTVIVSYIVIFITIRFNKMFKKI